MRSIHSNQCLTMGRISSFAHKTHTHRQMYYIKDERKWCFTPNAEGRINLTEERVLYISNVKWRRHEMQKLSSCFSLFVREIFTINQKTRRIFFNLPFLAFLLSARFYVPSSSLPYDENEFVWESPSSLEKQVKSEGNKLDFLHPENVWKCHREINFCNFTFGKEGKRLLEHFDEFMREKLIFKQFFSIAGKLLLRLVVWRVTFKEIFTTSKLVLKYVPKKSF